MYHTACSLGTKSSFGGYALPQMHTSLENQLVAFSAVGGGALHADFFFTVTNRISYLRSTLRETLLDSSTFKVDTLFETQRLKLLNVDWFDVASAAMLKSAVHGDLVGEHDSS